MKVFTALSATIVLGLSQISLATDHATISIINKTTDTIELHKTIQGTDQDKVKYLSYWNENDIKLAPGQHYDEVIQITADGQQTPFSMMNDKLGYSVSADQFGFEAGFQQGFIASGQKNWLQFQGNGAAVSNANYYDTQGIGSIG